MIYYKPEDAFPGVTSQTYPSGSLVYYRGYWIGSTLFDKNLYQDGYRRELTADLIKDSLSKLDKEEAPWLNDFLSQFSTAEEANKYLYREFRLKGRVVSTFDGRVEWRKYTRKAHRYLGGVFVECMVSLDYPFFYYSNEYPRVLDEDGITQWLLTYETCEEHPDQMFPRESPCPVCAVRYTIHEYTTDIFKVLKKKPQEKKLKGISLGVELEYDTDKGKVARALQPLDGFAIAKKDGSIAGYEIVSLPATLPEHLEIFKSFLFEEQETSRKTGMHVHIDNKGLTNLTVAKMYAFLYAKENAKPITKIAGRDFSGNCYCNTKAEENLLSRFTFSDDGVERQYSAERYTALNLNRKHDTIECRIFQSPSSWTEFAYRMQFVQAMIDYCSAVSIQAVKKWESFVEFVRHSHHKELKEVVC